MDSKLNVFSAVLASVLSGCGGSGSTSSADSGQDETTTSDRPPFATNDVYFVGQGNTLVTPLELGLFENDVVPDGASLGLADADGVSQAGATVEVNSDGSFVYSPPPAFWGTDRFGYTVETGDGETSSASVSVHVAPAVVDLARVRAGTGGFVIEGAGRGGSTGEHARGAGDVNGDGLMDLVLGNPLAGTVGAETGAAYVVFGKTDGGLVDLGALGGAGFVIEGVRAGDAAGVSVSIAGDVNGDGLADIIVGAPLADPKGEGEGEGPGAVYVVFGSSLADDVPVAALGGRGFSITGAEPGERAGQSVAAAGDMNGDGLADVIVGAPFASPRGYASGRTYIVFGKRDDADVELSSLGGGGVTIEGEAAGDWSGNAVVGIGDVNGDRFPDVAIAAPSARGAVPGAGRVYVVLGQVVAETIRLGSGNDASFVIEGESEESQIGSSISPGGDFDGDGHADLVLGVAIADGTGPNAGRAHLVFGAAQPPNVWSDALVGGLRLEGENAGDRLGTTVADAGDVNGDGFADLLLGAPYADASAPISGRVYVVYGGPDRDPRSLFPPGEAGFSVDGEHGQALLGRSLAAGGDINGDGVDDVLIGAREAYDDGGFRDRAYVVFGVPTVAP